MSVPSVPAGRLTPGDFRVGQVFSRTWSIFSRNLLSFVLVSAIPSLPGLLGYVVLPQPTPDAPPVNILTGPFENRWTSSSARHRPSK